MTAAQEAPTAPASAGHGLAVAFPGQGNKPDATADALARFREHPLVADCIRRFDLDAHPETDLLRDTRISQPVTYACGLASAEAELGETAPDLLLGHSLGELTALARAGVVDPADGLHLAVRRGEICRERQEARPGTMIAVMGTDATGIEWIRRHAVGTAGGVLEIAGLNGRRQTVLSGDTGTARAAIELAGELGVLAEELPIGGAFHSPLMIDAIGPWRAAVEQVAFSDARVPVVSAFDAAVHTDAGELRELLVRALLLPVRWLDALRAVRDAGAERFWDAGPGETLHKLGRRDRIVTFVSSPRPESSSPRPESSGPRPENGARP